MSFVKAAHNRIPSIACVPFIQTHAVLRAHIGELNATIRFPVLELLCKETTGRRAVKLALGCTFAAFVSVQAVMREEVIMVEQ